MMVVPVYQMVAVSVKVEAVVVPVVLVLLVIVVVLVMVVLVFNYLQHLEIQTPHTEHQDQVLRELSGLLVVEQGGHT
jgi:cell division protein FtsL|tara:strand:+ start:327 stop:557 length:231 start_codon:yes stop_codon:yes gene_type:complete